MSQAMEAQKRLGIQEAPKNFMVISDGPLDVDGRPVLVLAKKTEFTDAESRMVASYLGAARNLKAIYMPWQAYSGPGASLYIPFGDERLASLSASVPFRGLLASRTNTIENDPVEIPGCVFFTFHCAVTRRTIFYSQYPYNISPVYDSNPFFFFTLKTGDVFKKILSGTGRGMDWRINLGVTVLFMVFGISVVAVIAFLILPLWLTTSRVGAAASAAHRQRTPAATLLYFLFVGLGFILVEIALIQRFVLFLGHPTYALTVVVFLMLLASGAGSFASRRLVRDSARVWIPLLAIAAGIVLYRFILPVIISTEIGLAFATKLAISAGLLIPLGFLMGMPFPTGLRAMSERNDSRVEWAWALNAAASVLGSVSAMIIAIHFGLNVTLLCGAAAYVFAIFSRVR
jgi:hypothetical protein